MVIREWIRYTCDYQGMDKVHLWVSGYGYKVHLWLSGYGKGTFVVIRVRI